MKHLWVGIMLLGLALPALADMTIVETVHTDPAMGQPASDSNNTIYAKGNKARMNLNVPGSKAYVVYDLDTKKFWVVNDAKKEVTYGSIDQMLQMSGMMNGGAKATAKLTEGTGSKVINGWKCKPYHLTVASQMMNFDTDFWMTNDVDSKDLQPYKKMMYDALNVMTNADLDKLTGLVVSSQTKMSMVGSIFNSTSEVKSVSKDPVPDSVFKVPSDYKQQEWKVPPNPAH
jgi:Domain of unknown function (DUF4412)